MPFETLQVQPTSVVTATEPPPAPGPCVALFVASANVQLAGACATVSGRPAMLTTPVRQSAVGFASTRYVTAPLPELFNGERISIHGVVFDTLHAQPTSVVSVTEFVSSATPCVTAFVESE